eukprot:5058786-Amphidinium_carterae.1
MVSGLHLSNVKRKKQHFKLTKISMYPPKEQTTSKNNYHKSTTQTQTSFQFTWIESGSTGKPMRARVNSSMPAASSRHHRTVGLLTLQAHLLRKIYNGKTT